MNVVETLAATLWSSDTTEDRHGESSLGYPTAMTEVAALRSSPLPPRLTGLIRETRLPLNLTNIQSCGPQKEPTLEHYQLMLNIEKLDS